MRHPVSLILFAGMIFMSTACSDRRESAVARAIDSVNAIDQQNMAELMLTAADPDEAVAYFSARAERDPPELQDMRGLARSLVRAGRVTDALPVWRAVSTHPEAELDDQVMLADAYIRANDWANAGRTLNAIPPTHETFDRYRLEAMIADSKGDWARADHFYETATGLTTRPSGVLNNWGFSKLTRGSFREAERLFMQALQHDPTLFTAKNNLALARAGQGNYSLPIVRMTQQERAKLLYTLAIAAIRKGDVTIGQTLLEEAIDTHPQHYDDAVRALRALERGNAA
ncbi:MAG: tetratricopeptide repeat protein [Roseinatronobacter sp.]